MSHRLQSTKFTAISHLPLPALQTHVTCYRHPSGALHVHFCNKDPHRAFCVGFRTSPEDSTGLPHILEHTALCGSRRFPVRDPFFMMLRRSLQTFMNAMTYPDRTCYPFATQNLQDYRNLLAIYLDAAFCPNLDQLDFAQEGWRLAPEGDNWVIKGVVYNEMKGAMADSDSIISEAVEAALLPDTCYRFNSGGEPREIPRLEHADLVAFHRRTYCAANACFTTWGDLPLEEIHDTIGAYCEEFTGQAVALPQLQAPRASEQRVQMAVPLAEGQDPQDVSLTGMTWAWGDSASVDEVLLGELADQLLLGHAAAPLSLALESSGLGRSASGSGYQAYQRNGCFIAELQGIDPQRQEEFFPLLWQTLENFAAHGPSPEELASALHQLELRRRRIGGDGLPLGLQQGLRALAAWCCGGDILAALDQDSALERLRQRASDPAFWQRFTRERFLENQHRVAFTSLPDASYGKRQDEAERALVADMLQQRDDAGLAAARQLDEALNRRQNESNDPGPLPQLDIADVPAQRAFADGEWVSDGCRYFQAATGGLTYCYAAFPLGPLSPEQLAVLPTASGVVGKLGFAEHDYQSCARLLDACCGGVGAGIELVPGIDDPSVIQGYLVCSIHGLSSRAETWLPLLPQMLRQQRFDEDARLRELILMGLSHINESIIHQGHALAVTAAMRGLPGNAGLRHQLGGLGRRDVLRQLLGEDDQAQGRSQHAAASQQLLQHILSGSPVLALVSDGDAATARPLLDLLHASWEDFQPQRQGITVRARAQPAALPEVPRRTAYTTATPVSFAALALPGVGMADPAAAALAVACRYLTHDQLHRKIREQGGAYGAHAGWQASTGCVVLTSYRDPRLGETYRDLEAGLQWLASCPIDEEGMKEAKISLIGEVDKPRSPSGEARRRFIGDLTGNDPDTVNGFRQRILSVDGAAIHAAAAKHLNLQQARYACITSGNALERDGLDWPQVAL